MSDGVSPALQSSGPIQQMFAPQFAGSRLSAYVQHLVGSKFSLVQSTTLATNLLARWFRLRRDRRQSVVFQLLAQPF
jgi:hypothetical protein